MSRDHIMPGAFRKLNTRSVPTYSVILTVSLIILILVFLDPTGIAKLASAFQLLMFAFVCGAVIIMRESGIESYDPGYKSPFYPYMQIFGIFSPIFLIVEMGLLPVLFSTGLIVVGILWYKYYAAGRVKRSGAIYHIFEKLGRSRYDGLDIELRSILKEKGIRSEDQFDEIVMHSHVIDLESEGDFEDVTKRVSEWFSKFVNYSPEEIKRQFMEGTKIGATPVTHGVALPHLRIDGLSRSLMVLVRGKSGIYIKFNNPLTDHEEDEQHVNAIFYLVSPQGNPAQHLRILAQIAGRVDDDSFQASWIDAIDEHELKEALIQNERFVTLIIKTGDKTSTLIGKALKDINLPKDCLVALIKRGEYSIIPNGESILLENDRVTVIGNPRAVEEINKNYTGQSENLGE
jgi:mannitol/fructose-specific phosphotransferase system IIA component (Ntr-type)